MSESASAAQSAVTADLFADAASGTSQFRRLELPDAELTLYPGLLCGADAQRLFQCLRAEVAWQQQRIRVYGKQYPEPRLTAWYGDANSAYGYSGLRIAPRAWIAPLLEIRSKIAAVSSQPYNSVLVNRYRDGADGVGWHADDEPELGRNPVIASLSLGAVRAFHLRHRASGQTHRLMLPNGSLLIMAGVTQHHWQHRLAKTRRPVAERINLTFRTIN